MFAAILGLLKYAPAVFSAGKGIVEAVTGTAPPDEALESEEALASHIATLPPDQQAAIQERLIEERVRVQELDTERFQSMNEGDADKIRATARPEIALMAMKVIVRFSKLFRWFMILAVLQWLLDVAGARFDLGIADIPSLWDGLAKLAPVSEMIWAPTLMTLWASVDIIKKYMGCRERDKAHEYEIQAGRSLNSANATIEAAGGAISSLIKAIKR